MTALSADHLLSEAYTTTLQKQIFDSITTFSNQLVSKIQIINNEINKKVMSDLTNKYETLFSGLRDSFQTDVDEISSFIGDVRGLLNLPEEELIKYINEKKFGSGASKVTP
jgi:protein RED1